MVTLTDRLTVAGLFSLTPQRTRQVQMPGVGSSCAGCEENAARFAFCGCPFKKDLFSILILTPKAI